MLYRPDLAKNAFVCKNCGHHFRMHAFDRISMLIDSDFAEIGADIMPGDPLAWSDKVPYPQKLTRDREKSKLTEGVVCGFGEIGGFPVALGVMDFNFRGGTMGTVVGERITLLFEKARERKQPCIIFTASGGARMEEGMLALMQMAKTTLAVRRFIDDGGYYISVLTDPTTGGVSASFAFQANVIVAEAKAAIGFAGRRVIEQTIRQKLPDNFQTAEFLLEKGAIDMVVVRAELRALLVRLLDYGAGTRERASLVNGRAGVTR
jgi:acetyl-CoA carboxylase carboxyl transferase subunit beta